MTTTNILIVGNGFDLSHYLPTKYDHFMDVMEAIESHNGDSMNFEELFSKCREDWFIAETKKNYLIQNIFLEKEYIEKLKKLIAENCWYQYFKTFVKEVKTWIDFEQRIENVLSVVKCFFNDLKKIDDPLKIYNYFDENSESLKISKPMINILEHFKVISDEYYQNDYLKNIYNNTNYYQGIMQGETRKNINQQFCYGGEIKNGFNPSEFLNYMYKELETFIEIFDLYLDLIVSQLSPKGVFDIQSKEWIQPDKIFSFNYTNTYQRIYDSIDVDYLHGSHGEFQNIVLGISDIEDNYLKKLKAYGFTKYHQKLFKDTDYLFLDSYKEQIKQNRYELHTYDTIPSDSPVRKSAQRKIWAQRGELNLNFLIWGHSLDYSDKDYIIDLFSLNDDMDRNVRVTVFFYDKVAKFSLLNNLLAILDKNKVEQWMKKGWLKFKQNPEIYFGVDTKDELIEEAS